MKILNLIAYAKKGYEQNIGDAFSALALKKYLKQPGDKYYLGFFNQKKYDLAKYDLVVIGGGGLYHPGHLKNLEENLNLLATTTPLAIIGVGLNLDGSQKFKAIDNQRLIKLTQRAFINSVRDQWSYDYLNSLQITTQLTGGPCHFLPELYSLKPRQAYHLGLNFSLKHTGFYEQKSPRVLKFIETVAKKLPGQKLIICHAKKEKKLFQSIFPGETIFYSNSPPKVFAAYQSCQLVLGMRGHSQIFSHAVNTPCLALGLNEKVNQPNKMAFKNPRPFLLSLDESLSSVQKKISYLNQHRSAIKKQQQKLKAKLKQNFLSVVKSVYEYSSFS